LSPSKVIANRPYARNGLRQCPRFLIAVATLVGVLATFCAGAQSSTGTVKWGAGNGYPPGPYPSPDEACAIVLNGLRGAAEGWGPNAYTVDTDAVANPAGWDNTPIGEYPYSATYCNFTQTIYDCGTSCPYVMQITNGLPYVYAISPPAALAKMTLESLPGLVMESEVIVYGQAVPTSRAASTKSTVSFQAESVLKGSSIVAHGLILLCNSHDNSEWPDLNTLTGRVVIFVSRKGECFDLSHGYRSIVQTKAGRTSTNAIKDQPDDQTIASFLRKIRTVVAKQTQSVH
jgi:hypothetical protein